MFTLICSDICPFRFFSILVGRTEIEAVKEMQAEYGRSQREECERRIQEYAREQRVVDSMVWKCLYNNLKLSKSKKMGNYYL